ncbi:MAG: hypothetical protein KDD02_16240 [Phaeodactylibacter sp.]|nr:hypothetical protein [Phaeodactylibacter sp.]MCB9299799.1 hypothetical protein [Lewinellaceae bacterium]
MGVEEWRIEWLPAPEEIVISLEGYTGSYPVLLEIYRPDGCPVYRRQYTQPVLSLPGQLLPAGRYRYEVKFQEECLQVGRIEL